MQKRYYARKGKILHPIGTDAAADKLLADGYEIISRANGADTVIARPETGWIGQRPAIVRKYQGCSISK